MKITFLLFVCFVGVVPSISARNVQVEIEDSEFVDASPYLQPGALYERNVVEKVVSAVKTVGSNYVTSALGTNASQTLSDLKESLKSGDVKQVAEVVASADLSAFGTTGDTITNISQAIADGNNLKAAGVAASAALSSLGSKGKAISSLGIAVVSKDKKKIAGAVADAALTVTLGSSGASLAKTGIGAAGKGLGKVGDVVGEALISKGGNSTVGKLGDSIQNKTSKVSSIMVEYAGVQNYTALQLVSQVADAALTVGLGPASSVAKPAIGAAGVVLQVGGNVVGNKLSSKGENSTAGKLGNAIQSGSGVVGGIMTYVGGLQSENSAILAAGKVLNTTGSFVGDVVTQIAGTNEGLAKLGQKITNGTNTVSGTLIDIGNGDIDKVIEAVSDKLTAAAA